MLNGKNNSTGMDLRILKFNQSNCTYDTVSRSNGLDFALLGANRGFTSACDYFVCPCTSANPNNVGILFMGLNQDTSFILVGPQTMYIEYEFNPLNNCIYGITNEAKIYEYNLTTMNQTLIAQLPISYAFTCNIMAQYCTIDIDSNILYCKKDYTDDAIQKMAMVNLNNGQIDSTELNTAGDSIILAVGLFFDRDRRLIIGCGWHPASDKLLIAFNPETNIKSVIGNLISLEEGDEEYYAYDDFNNIYTIHSLISDNPFIEKYYNYNSVNGVFLDSCTNTNKLLPFYNVEAFYPNCDNAVGISEKPNVSNIIIYPNPASDELFIDGFTKNVIISIFDISGKLLRKEQLKTKQIDISGFSKGMYFIKFTTEEGSFVRKFVKE